MKTPHSTFGARPGWQRAARATACAALSALAFVQAAAAATPAPQRPASGWLVEWKTASRPALAGAVTAGWQRLPPEASPLAWRRDARVRSVVPDVREQALSVAPNDSLYPNQWWLQTLVAQRAGVGNFSAAWLRSTGNPVSGATPVVAVLDSGITSHPDLNARLLPGWDFVSDALYANDGNGRDNDPQDPGDAISDADRSANPAAFSGCPPAPRSSWHGTLMAGQVGAVSNNVEGVAAGNWFARVLPVRIAGKCGAAVSDIIDGMRWAAGLPVDGAPLNPNPARVIVIGYGGIDACDVNSANDTIAATARLYVAALAEVRQAGALVVAAAGNLRSTVGRPASCAGAFGVTALNREGFKAAYANFGAGLSLATPGGDAGSGGTCDAELGDGGIVSTGNLGPSSPGAAGYASASGTSFAAPAVAAAATLMLALSPGLTVPQLEDGLKRSARPFVDVPPLGSCSLGGNRSRCGCTPASCGAGMLDVDEALRFAAAPQSYVPLQRTAFVLNDSRVQTCAALLGLPPLPETPPPQPPPQPQPPLPSPTPEPPQQGGGSGGGATSWPWLLALCCAVVQLSRSRPGSDRRG